MSNTTELVVFIIYLLCMVGIGLFFFLRSRGGGEKEYFLGGRKMGPWVSALSAGASDMSAWVLMGLPASVYALGLGQQAVRLLPAPEKVEVDITRRPVLRHGVIERKTVALDHHHRQPCVVVEGRQFWNLTDINAQVLEWCEKQNGRYHKEIDDIPAYLHTSACQKFTSELSAQPSKSSTEIYSSESAPIF